MSKFRRIAISPELVDSFSSLDQTEQALRRDVERGANFGDIYDRRDVPHQMTRITQNRDELIQSFINDFPLHAKLLQYTPFYDILLSAGTRRIWLCYQVAKSMPDNLAFIERIADVLGVQA
jgi:hypothetical protein